MPATDQQELERILQLRLDQIDRVERAVQDDRDSHHAIKRRCEMRLRARLLKLMEELPWRHAAGGQELVDRSSAKARRQITRVRERMLAAVEEERDRLERDLIRPKRLRRPLRV